MDCFTVLHVDWDAGTGVYYGRRSAKWSSDSWGEALAEHIRPHFRYRRDGAQALFASQCEHPAGVPERHDGEVGGGDKQGRLFLSWDECAEEAREKERCAQSEGEGVVCGI